MKEIRKFIKENFAIILATIPVLGILMQGIILSSLGIIAFFSFEHIFVDTFYMIQILLLWFITICCRLAPFIANKYEWKDLLRYGLVSFVIILVSIGISSKLIIGIAIVNLIMGIWLNINYLVKHNDAKRSFGYIIILGSFILNVLFFNHYLFDGVYDKETNLRVVYLNDKYVLLENKTILGNNDRIFFLSGSSMKIPFID